MRPRSRFFVVALIVAVLFSGGVAASYAVATNATDDLLAQHGGGHWRRRALLALPWTSNENVKPFTWVVTYYEDLDRPNPAFCEATQFTVSLAGRVLRTFGDPASWVACLRGDTARVGAAPNKRLKLAARVDYGMNLSSARRSLSAIR